MEAENLNLPKMIPAELHSWNRSFKLNLLLLHLDRSSYSSYSPQKVRLEDGGERGKTLNCLMRILAELCSWNRSLKPNLLQVDRNRRLCDGGWKQTRTSSSWRNSRSHRNRGENSLQSVHRYRVRFITNLEIKISQTSEVPCRDLCRADITEV